MDDTPISDTGNAGTPDPNATGSDAPLPHERPGTPGREEHERAAALRRGELDDDDPPGAVCAPIEAGLRPEMLFTLLADNVRDYAVFLMDINGIIRCWGESARLMKWWSRPQAEGSHLRFLYKDGGSEDGTAEAHLQAAAEQGEYTGEGHRVRSDGSTFWAGVTLAARWSGSRRSRASFRRGAPSRPRCGGRRCPPLKRSGSPKKRCSRKAFSSSRASATSSARR
jgi:hypothetical protein